VSSSKDRQKRSLGQAPGEVKAPQAEGRTLMRSAGLVSVFTLLSRILGLIRDVVFARLVGLGPYADLYREANAFCAEQKKQFVKINVTEQDNKPFVRLANAKLEFRCVTEGTSK
jgi:hypothetical protein